MIDLDATQPVALTPTVPDIPLTIQRRTYRRRRHTAWLTWLRVVAICAIFLLGLSPAVFAPMQGVITVLAIGMAALMLVTGIILLVWAVVP